MHLEREELFFRLKRLLETVERILNDPEMSPALKLRAAEIIAIIAGKANTIIRDCEVEMSERLRNFGEINLEKLEFDP